MTAMCLICFEAPVHAKGQCHRCYQRSIATKCTECGAYTRSSRRRCKNHPPECEKPGCAAVVGPTSWKFCAEHTETRKSRSRRGQVSTCTKPGCKSRVWAEGRVMCAQHHRHQQVSEANAAKRRYCATEGCVRALRTEHDKCAACREAEDRPFRVRDRSAEKLRPRKRKPKRKAQVKVELSPLAPWNPNALANVDMRPPKTTGGGGGPVSIGRIEPTPEYLVRRLQSRYAATGREDLLTVLGIAPGDERIPLLEDEAHSTRQDKAA